MCPKKQEMAHEKENDQNMLKKELPEHIKTDIVERYHTIRRCNNYVMLQSIPCSLECKIIRQILLDNPLSYALTATADVSVVYLQQFWRTKKEAIQYPRFIKLIIADLMKKFPDIPQRVDEDYHSIKNDTSLIRVYTTGNVLVRGMLIPDTFLTEEIRVTNDFMEYKMVAHRKPTVSTASPQGKKRKQIAEESSSPHKSLRITIRKKQVVEGEKDDDDSEDRLEPGSHKENPEYIDCNN
ncbi:hypothetical protein Tco_1424739 [Tanacetum coccineum]